MAAASGTLQALSSDEVHMTALLAVQVARLYLDLRSRQQQVDAMRGELSTVGVRTAAVRQETDTQAEILMEELAITQANAADIQVKRL